MNHSYPSRTTVAVQWGDVDRMGHVNNVVFFRWFETARTRYFEEAGFERFAAAGIYPILASIRCDYRAQLKYPDTISVECSTSKLGRSSCAQVYRVVSTAQNKVVAEGEGTWVCFDYNAQRAVALPHGLIEAMEKFEGRSLR